MYLKINKKSLDNVINNVTDISYLLQDQKDLYNILELETIINSKTITLGDLYEYESHLKRLKLNFPKTKGLKPKEKIYVEDISSILKDITSAIHNMEEDFNV
jgi:hypothetical protein